MKIFLINIIVLLTFITGNLFSQAVPGNKQNHSSDSTYIFSSPRPLMNFEGSSNNYSKAYGIDLLFSQSGFGLGFFYNRYLSESLSGLFSFYISGARNSDEFEMINYFTGDITIPDKINRLYIFPMMFGLEQQVFQDVLYETMKPFISGGLGPTFILQTPYDKSFFTAFKYGNGYTRFGCFVGFGSNFGTNNILRLNIRYYNIPFGGDGLESKRNSPIKNFGGVFLSLSFGVRS